MQISLAALITVGNISTASNSICCKPYALVTNVEDGVVMLQKAGAQDIETFQCIDNCLTRRHVVCEGTNIKLAAGNGQVKGCSVDRSEWDINRSA